jgi:lipid-binding SYLF domain-containing protein
LRGWLRGLPETIVAIVVIDEIILVLRSMRAEVLTYSRTRGLFAGIDLSGAAISQDKDETRILFGQMVPFQDILHGKVAPPAGSEPFLAAVRRYSMQAKDQAANTN